MAARAEATNFISLLVSIWIVGLLQQARAEIKVASFLIDEFTDRKYETELELDWVKDVIIKVMLVLKSNMYIQCKLQYIIYYTYSQILLSLIYTYSYIAKNADI